MKVNRAEFLNAMAKLLSVVPKKPVIPIISHVLATKYDGGLRLSATDTTSSMSVLVAADSPSDFCAPAADLQSIVAGLDGDEVTIKQTERRLGIACGSAKFSLAISNAADFPKVDAPSMMDALSLPTALFASAVASVLYAVLADAAKPHLNAMSIVPTDGGSLDFMATDGHRLALRTIQAERGLGRDVLVSLPAANAVMKMLGSDENVLMAVSGETVGVTSGSATFTTKLVPAPVVQYRNIIPTPVAAPSGIDRGRFLAALKRALLVKAAGKETDQQGDLILSVGSIALTRENTDAKSEETVTCDGGHDGKVRCNLKYLYDAVASFDDDNLELHSGEWCDPIVIREKTGKQIAMIAPARS